ncbi:MAG: hypothetical protein AAFX99_14690 [Myxococcota bacterium]
MSGSCVNRANAQPCDDGLFCNGPRFTGVIGAGVLVVAIVVRDTFRGVGWRCIHRLFSIGAFDLRILGWGGVSLHGCSGVGDRRIILLFATTAAAV